MCGEIRLPVRYSWLRRVRAAEAQRGGYRGSDAAVLPRAGFFVGEISMRGACVFLDKHMRVRFIHDAGAHSYSAESTLVQSPPTQQHSVLQWAFHSAYSPPFHSSPRACLKHRRGKSALSLHVGSALCALLSGQQSHLALRPFAAALVDSLVMHMRSVDACHVCMSHGVRSSTMVDARG